MEKNTTGRDMFCYCRLLIVRKSVTGNISGYASSLVWIICISFLASRISPWFADRKWGHSFPVNKWRLCLSCIDKPPHPFGWWCQRSLGCPGTVCDTLSESHSERSCRSGLLSCLTLFQLLYLYASFFHAAVASWASDSDAYRLWTWWVL